MDWWTDRTAVEAGLIFHRLHPRSAVESPEEKPADYGNRQRDYCNCLHDRDVVITIEEETYQRRQNTCAML